MKSICLFICLFISSILVSACSGIPKDLIMWHDDDTPAYAKGDRSTGKAASREPLDVPPELRAELELPGAEKIAGSADEKVLPEKYQKAVAGKAVALDARMYKLTPAEVFSAVVDAMTSLNIPVESVDSPSGIVTSDWIRRGVHSMSIFGGDSGNVTRHRFIVRVYRAKLEDKLMTRLEIRVLGQAFSSRRWVNKPIKRKVSEELFTAVDEQLTRMQATALPLDSAN
jgi:hypothetical protein